MKIKARTFIYGASGLALVALLSTVTVKLNNKRKLPEMIESMFEGSTMTAHSMEIEIQPGLDRETISAHVNLVHHFKYDKKTTGDGSKSTYSLNYRIEFPALVKLSGKDSKLYLDSLRTAYQEQLRRSRTVATEDSGLAKKPAAELEYLFVGVPMSRQPDKSVKPLTYLRTSDLWTTYTLEPVESLPIDPTSNESYLRSKTNVLLPTFVDLKKFTDLTLTLTVDEQAVLSSLDPDRAEVFRRFMNGSVRFEVR